MRADLNNQLTFFILKQLSFINSESPLHMSPIFNYHRWNADCFTIETALIIFIGSYLNHILTIKWRLMITVWG